MDVRLVLVPWILEVSAFMADVPDVLVSGVDLFCRLSDRNVVLVSIFDQVFSGLEVPDTPRSDDLDSRVQRFNG